VIATFSLVSCATEKKDIFPQDLEPMTAIYDQHFAGIRSQGIEGARSKLHGPHDSNTPEASEGKNTMHESEEGTSRPVDSTIEPLVVKGNALNLEDYTRTAVSELNVLFPLLPNPTLVMYVYPHLAEERAGVPGYVTQFRLYERDEYALPGEFQGAEVNP
jgi:conjugative transfer region lipoprotein (TIGR03751 family)